MMFICNMANLFYCFPLFIGVCGCVMTTNGVTVLVWFLYNCGGGNCVTWGECTISGDFTNGVFVLLG